MWEHSVQLKSRNSFICLINIYLPVPHVQLVVQDGANKDAQSQSSTLLLLLLPRNVTDEILYSRCLVFIRLETLHQIIMDGGLQCQICPYKAPRMVRLKRHMEVTHQGLRLACGFCQYTSAESSNLKKHIQRVHEHLRYTCEHCNRIFSEKHILKKHLGFVHLNKPRPIFSCNECKKEFYTREAQRRHTSSVHLGISYPMCKM